MTAPAQNARLSTPDSRLTTHDPRFIEVVQVATPMDRLAALEIRRRVFAQEQHAADLRVADADDERSIIALASLHDDEIGNHKRPVATGRLTPPLVAREPALVAWVATVPEARGLGAGAAVMRFLLDAADSAGAREVALAAQLPAEAFYRRLGFTPAGPLYDVRGIPHRRMVRRQQ
ncbi:MAG: GNAT family N-acetyltransferase [Chloroflexota bacterium]|nr:GNAT family N-acetyltransferase [Chloroflexia bacterium]MDQ3227144.1 GNAT family N-acetyltransferase [Chloroflexota bacterium]